jgi:hypothetical protein
MELSTPKIEFFKLKKANYEGKWQLLPKKAQTSRANQRPRE